MLAQQQISSTPEDIARIIREDIRPVLQELARCRSTLELERSSAYLDRRAMIEQVLSTVQTSRFAGEPAPARSSYRILAWNIERGKELAGQIEAFREHPYLRTCDVLLLTETDVGMARSGNVDVARTLAMELGFDYAFIPCYLSLVKGSGTERDVDGDNDLGLHGNAILSRYPIVDPVRIRLKNGIDKMASKEQRLGSQCALAATIDLPGLPLTVACVHLDANSKQRHRADQMRAVVQALPSSGPALIGGDWNTTTFDSSSAFNAIMGYFLRVLMGPGNVIRNHYLHPYRWFERELFRLLAANQFDINNCNQAAEPTIHYDVTDIRAHKGLAEWVPGWCFPFIRWALREHGGSCPLKIDWFAARTLDCANPIVIHDVGARHTVPLSDHDAIGVDVRVP
ncbi:MAG: endonuclease/exonuclease/phosphatase family protein [Bryobacteraceae bacterium]